ncbi:AAA family ATPase [Nonomuraea gerenzanensis]|uniref:MoxR-like ATPases n=1 Tax=Nonomuraea gerenzanensis TaxID=93944 RepID=A0A1M4E601_9ACTN|nr:MoxR family ATPase [Nonomuraea gerenzanensis]UBU16459.1 AAA family ATPase [Nonomuraea gerenzanensis]SBO94279.1 MoxR-like ATPases [Nonomuraea gerenzanensis]
MDALSVAVAANLPVLLWGAPGTGKTSAVLALGERLGLPVEVVVGSIREPSDFAGLPMLREGKTWFAPPRWAERLAAAGRGILFLDELTTAPPAVQAAMLRVVLERVVGDLALPAQVRIVAAANPPEQAADGWELSAPLANRLVHLDWRVSAESVAEGFIGGFSAPAGGFGEVDGACTGRARALVGAFLRVRPELVLVVPEGGGRGWPSPRTWELAATALACTSTDAAASDGATPAGTSDGATPAGASDGATPAGTSTGTTPAGTSDGTTPAGTSTGTPRVEAAAPGMERVRAELVVGAVGEAAGFELLSWLRDLDLPDPATLLADPAAPLPDRVDRVHAVLGSVVAHVTADGSADAWQRAWTVIGRVARRTPDVAATAARSLAAHRPHGAVLPPTVLELAPILRSAGLMP